MSSRSSALDLQDMLLHMLQQIIDEVDVGVGQLIVLGMFSLTALPVSHHNCEFSCIAPASSPSVAMSNGWGQFSCFHDLMVGSPIPTPPGPTLLESPRQGVGAVLPSAAAGEGQGLFCSYYLRANSLIYHNGLGGGYLSLSPLLILPHGS